MCVCVLPNTIHCYILKADSNHRRRRNGGILRTFLNNEIPNRFLWTCLSVVQSFKREERKAQNLKMLLRNCLRLARILLTT